MKKKITWTIVILAILLIPIGIILQNDHEKSVQKSDLISAYTSYMEGCGLEDVSVELRASGGDYGYDYYADIYSSNFSKLSYSRMISITDSCYIDGAVIGDYYCDGASYHVIPYVNRVRRDGELVYDGYYSSDSYKDATKNDNSSGSSSESSSSSSGSSNSSSGKSSSGSKRGSTDSYDAGYDSIMEDDDYDWDRYWSDKDYQSGVDDAIDDYDDEYGESWE